MNQAFSTWKTRQFHAFHTRSRAITRFKHVNRADLLHALSNNSTQTQANSYKHPAEKIVRLIVHVVAIIGMIIMITDVTLEFLSSPTVTTAETNSYPIQKVDFPAIAICSINRISRRSAADLAAELMEFDTTTYVANLTRKDLTEMLALMGNLYSFKLNELDKLNLLHTILERGYNGYDVNRIMKRLTPKCRNMLRRCAWEGKDQVCDDLFYLRRTDNGYCCVFNYVRQNDGFGSSETDVFTTQQTLHTKAIGPEYGLSVLLNPQIEDAAYELLPSYGFKVQIYLSLDYPDATSGGMRELLVPPKTETHLDLSAVTFHTDRDVEQYDIHKRDCLFSTEQSKIFHGHYSFSDCVMHCRVRDILELCKCVPFFYPILENGEDVKTCNLKDIPCLKKYKDKWLRLKPRYEENMVPFTQEVFEGKSGYLTCNCLPSCADISYRVSASSMPLSLPEVSWGRMRYTIRNHSIVHIFYGRSGIIRLRQGALFYGYELMSNYGGICSLFLGVSMISLVEILYKVMAVICASEDKDSPKEQPVTVEHKKIEDNLIMETEKSEVTLEPSVLYWNEITRSVSRKEVDLTNAFLKRLNTH